MITSDREKILDAMNGQFLLSLGIGNLVRELDSEVKRATAARRPPRPRGLRRYVGKDSGSA